MSEPLQNNLQEEITKSEQVIANLASQYFTGKNAEILQALLRQLPYNNLSEFMQEVFPALTDELGLETLNNLDIEEFNFMRYAKNIDEAINPETLPVQTQEEVHQFEETLKEFSHAALHDVAFPMMVLENPNVAVSVKNLLKRVIATMQGNDEIDITDVFARLDIENLPTEFSFDLFSRLGGNIPGFSKSEAENNSDFIHIDNEPAYVVDVDLPIEEEKTEGQEDLELLCELTSAQAIYLAYDLEKNHNAIRNWRSFYRLLKGKKIDYVIVTNDEGRKKLGLLITVLDKLHTARDEANESYLRSNKGNGGIWPFFQEYLVFAKKQDPIDIDIRKELSKFYQEEEGKKIVDHLLDPRNHLTIKNEAKKINNEVKRKLNNKNN